MKKFVVCALFAVASIGAATGLMSNNISVLGSTKNEYGCQGNCTGEYEVRHVKQILTDYPSKNNTDGVRIKARLLFKDNQ